MRGRLTIGCGFAAYLFGVPLVSALISPWLYWALVPMGLDAEAFRKLVFRLMELLAIIGVWPLLIWLLGGATAVGWGLASGRQGRMRDLVIGIGVGSLMFIGTVVVLFIFDIRQLELSEFRHIDDWVKLILKAIAVGLLVAMVEELWLRGGLYTAIAGAGGKIMAVLMTALLYACVHFVRTDREIASEDVDWISGFAVVFSSFDRLVNISYIWDSWLTLFTAGLMLGILRSRYGNIMLAIGVHAGWVMVIQVIRKISDVTVDPSTTLLVGTFDGVLGLPLVAFGFIATHLLLRYRVAEGTAAGSFETDAGCRR